MRTPPYRPILNLPISPEERAVGLAATLGLVLSLMMLAIYWPSLPAIIPTHFGPSGQPNGWGPKSTFLIFPVVVVVLYVVLWPISRMPQKFNYPVRITEENAPRQYTLARSFLGWIRLEIVWLLTYMEWKVVQVVRGETSGMGPWFLAVVLVFMFGASAIYFVRAYRAK